MAREAWRQLTENEKRLIGKLLSRNFPGVDVLTRYASNLSAMGRLQPCGPGALERNRTGDPSLLACINQATH